MRSDDTLADEVRMVMASTFDVDVDELSDEVSQDTCSQWSSLAHVSLLLAFEERFATRLSMEEMAGMTSLPRITTILRQHGAG